MRKIKFRAWLKATKTMFFVKIITMTPEGVFACFLTDEDVSCDVNPDEIILIQFTGLQDKNGKEIYEGDIVKAYRKDRKLSWVGSVKYSNEYLDYRVYTYPEHCYFRLNEFYPVEVIGNIYENPELIKGE